MKKEEVGQGVLYCVPNMSARPPRTLNLISSSSALFVDEGGGVLVARLSEQTDTFPSVQSQIMWMNGNTFLIAFFVCSFSSRITALAFYSALVNSL